MEPNQIIDPKSGDVFRAKDILDELCAVMRKYGYALIFNPQRGTMVLGQHMTGPGVGPQIRVIAEVQKILPEAAVWREMDWTPRKPQ